MSSDIFRISNRHYSQLDYILLDLIHLDIELTLACLYMSDTISDGICSSADTDICTILWAVRNANDRMGKTWLKTVSRLPKQQLTNITNFQSGTFFSDLEQQLLWKKPHADSYIHTDRHMYNCNTTSGICLMRLSALGFLQLRSDNLRINFCSAWQVHTVLNLAQFWVAGEL